LAGLQVSIKDLFDVKGEFAFSGLGWNPHFGTPRSPFDAERIAGGSTSGGASAWRAACRCPRRRTRLARWRDPYPAAPSSTAYSAARNWTQRRPPWTVLRLYVTPDYVMDGLDHVVAQAFEASLSALSARGARILAFNFPELRDLPAINAGGGLTAAKSWAWHRELLERSGGLYDQWVAQRIRRGGNQSATDYIDLLAARTAMQRRHRCPQAAGSGRHGRELLRHQRQSVAQRLGHQFSGRLRRRPAYEAALNATA
jgi:aspartyl-tRNA(Asn)/glutamyl-tRNA(Gln) amidotransferase subunit A